MTEDHLAFCKFCSCHVTLKIDPESLGMWNMETWKAMAACNRCADYHTARLATARFAHTLAMRFMRAEAANDSELMEAQRSKIIEATRKLATLASKHYRAGFTWESDWVTQITEQPQNTFKMCSFYEAQMRKAASRLIRDGSIVLDVQAQDFNLRPST